MRENVLESKMIYRGRVVSLRVDKVQMPDGKIAEREVVEHRGAVAIVPLLNSETVLLIRQYRQAVGEVLLEIPAGTLESGELPDACASRELEEETGYRADRLKRLFSQYLAPGYSQEVLHVYLAEELKQTTQQTEEDEHLELAPFPLDAVPALIEQGEIKDAKTIAGLLMTLRRLGI